MSLRVLFHAHWARSQDCLRGGVIQQADRPNEARGGLG